MYMNIFSMALPDIPLYIAWVVGFAMALARRQRHPRVSLFAACGFALLFLAALAGNFVWPTLPMMLSGRGIAPGQFGPWFLAVGLVQSLIRTVATGLLIAAVFARRQSDQ